MSAAQQTTGSQQSVRPHQWWSPGAQLARLQAHHRPQQRVETPTVDVRCPEMNEFMSAQRGFLMNRDTSCKPDSDDLSPAMDAYMRARGMVPDSTPPPDSNPDRLQRRVALMLGVALTEQMVRMPVAAYAAKRTMTGASRLTIVSQLARDPKLAYGTLPVFSLGLGARLLQRVGLFGVNDEMKERQVNPLIRVGIATGLETLFLAGSEAVTATYTLGGKAPSFRNILFPKGGVAGICRNLAFNLIGLGVEAETSAERFGVAVGACVVSQPAEVMRYVMTLGKNMTYRDAAGVLLSGGVVRTVDGKTVSFSPFSFFRALLPRVGFVGAGFSIAVIGWSYVRGEGGASSKG